MRLRRFVSKDTAIYHCMSRTVNGEAWLGDREKEVLRKMIHQVADFSGVEVLTYCIMNNHFHVLVKVVPVDVLSDSELLRRFAVLYPKPTDYQQASAEDLKRVLAQGGETAETVRAQFQCRMGDVSQFMKTLKQRFSIWFNKSRDRYGPVWSDRFKSVLVEGKGFALQTMAAYIDLNPVRAGIVRDPKDYRFCGYAEAIAGVGEAVAGIRFISAGETDLSAEEAMQGYRQLLFGKGGSSVEGAAAISRADAVRVLEKEGGRLSTPVLLRCRIRYYTEGAILGSREFVESFADEWKRGRRRKNEPKVRSVPGEDGDVSCINRGRGRVFS